MKSTYDKIGSVLDLAGVPIWTGLLFNWLSDTWVYLGLIVLLLNLITRQLQVRYLKSLTNN